MSHPPAVHLTTHMKTKATTKKKPPVVTRENGRPTINAEAVDELIEDVKPSPTSTPCKWCGKK
jgi:hypothetical protein